jgi:GDP-L-fucose synthase
MAIEQLVENMVNSGETSGAWRVLVTGGSGLVGKAIEKHVNQLSASGNDANHWYFASSKDADLCDFEQTKALFEREKPTHVVHLAAKVGGLFANLDGNIQFLRDNLAMNDNVIKLCHDYDVKNAIFCLSTCIFPAEVELPMTEDDIHKGSPHPSNQGYAHAKRILEVLVRLHRETYGHNWMCLIPTNVYGPYTFIYNCFARI